MVHSDPLSFVGPLLGVCILAAAASFLFVRWYKFSDANFALAAGGVLELLSRASIAAVSVLLASSAVMQIAAVDVVQSWEVLPRVLPTVMMFAVAVMILLKASLGLAVMIRGNVYGKPIGLGDKA